MQVLRTITGLAFAAALAAGGTAFAEEQHFTATMTGGEEVPPVETSATGTADITYDTETMELT
jgi:hypothetical protein